MNDQPHFFTDRQIRLPETDQERVEELALRAAQTAPWRDTAHICGFTGGLLIDDHAASELCSDTP